MFKKALATAAVAASVVGATGFAASPAMAVADNNRDVSTQQGNGESESYGHTTTGGYMSPNMALVNGSLNKPCIAVPVTKTNVLDGIAGIGGGVSVNDILTSQNNQNCSENSTQVDGDDPLSHLLEDLPIISQNGAGNGN